MYIVSHAARTPHPGQRQEPRETDMGQQTHNDKPADLAVSLTDARERMIAVLGPLFGEAFDGDFDTMLEAAAALTAAAELLEACEAIVSSLEGGPVEPEDAIASVRAAIAKATGGAA